MFFYVLTISEENIKKFRVFVITIGVKTSRGRQAWSTALALGASPFVGSWVQIPPPAWKCLIGEKMIDKFLKVANKIKPSDKVMIYHDTDPDGITSAFLLKKYLENKKGIVEINYTPHQEGPRKVNPYMEKQIEKVKPEYLFIMDLSYDDDLKGLKSIKDSYNISDILIIDHHKINPSYEEYEKENIYVIKPQLFSEIPPERYPTSKLTYDLVKTDWENAKRYWWIIALGILGDMAYMQWKESFFDINLKDSNFTLEDLVHTEELLSYALSSNENNIVPKILEYLEESNSPIDLKNKLKKYEIIEKEVNRFLSQHKEKAEIHPEVNTMFYNVETTYNIRSRIASILSQMYPDYTIIVYGTKEGNPDAYIISLRNHLSKVDVANLVKTLSKEIPSLQGGGHKPAAGAIIEKKYMDLFKKKVLEMLKGE